jgi:bifunctional non-homologous end joining protein LigD
VIGSRCCPPISGAGSALDLDPTGSRRCSPRSPTSASRTRIGSSSASSTASVAFAFGRDGTVVLKSRNGNDVTGAYPEIVAAFDRLRAADTFVADGEIVAFVGEQTSFQQLQRRIHLRAADRIAAVAVPISFHLFDLLYLDGADITELPLVERKRLLASSFTFRDPLRLSEHRLGDGEAFFEEACRRGWEGLIAKRAESSYSHGRSRDWLKFKCSFGQEFVIGGYTDPRGARVGFGALLLGVYEGGRLMYAGKVGTGFDTATLRDLHARLLALAGKASPFDVAGSARRDAAGASVHWVKPELVAQVDFSEWTADGRLRHPRFLGLRTDKDPREVVRERPSG